MKWRKAAHATLYRLQASTSSAFATSVLDTMITDTAFTVSALAASQTYYWRVFAANANSATKPSTARSFTTKSSGVIAQQEEHETADVASVATLEPSLSVYPNPASNVTSVEIDIPELAFGEISLHNEQGALIESIASGNLQGGRSTLPLDLSELPQGTYFVRMIIGEKVYAKRISVIR